MKGDLRCVEGRLMRHDPQHDDPELETDRGECPDCSGSGCSDDDEPVSKAGRSNAWLHGGGIPVGELARGHWHPGDDA